MPVKINSSYFIMFHLVTKHLNSLASDSLAAAEAQILLETQHAVVFFSEFSTSLALLQAGPKLQPRPLAQSILTARRHQRKSMLKKGFHENRQKRFIIECGVFAKVRVICFTAQ